MMEFHLLLCVVGALCLNGEATVARKFVLQNEMSEHCRRRVVSSVFLGRQVAESSAEVMHFSRLDLPYSCSISVRTESGSNIVLVILSKSEKSITSSCTEGHDQLLVYEMGETFGGYWAALPESVFQQEPRNYSAYYTLKTTEPLLETIDTGMTDYNTNYAEEITSLSTSQDETERNYVVMEVPLVNVSGNLELGETELTPSDEEEMFDLIYDVTPKNGVLYETSMMPLVQFSIWKQNEQKQGLMEKKPRYQLDYNMQGFTPDYRLLYRTKSHKRKFSNHPHYSTRRLKLKKKNKALFSVHNWTRRIQAKSQYFAEVITTKSMANTESLDFTFKNGTDTLQLIESYLKLYNNNYSVTSPENMDGEVMALLEKISNIKHNASVYLQRNLSKYNDSSVVQKENVKRNKIINNYTNITTDVLSTIPFRINDPQHSTNKPYNVSHMNDITTTNIKIEISTNATSRTTKTYGQEFTTSMFSSINSRARTGLQSTPVSRLENFKTTLTVNERKSSGSLVNHESWENIVQVAPVMADLLNVTTASQNNVTNTSKAVRNHTPSLRAENKINRKKRYIQALAIDSHRPRQLTTKEDDPTPARSKHQLDSHHLAEVVELQDDEIEGRVALHYFNNYVGPTIFNMCDYHEAKVRQVYLLNSSRIIIAINNFTMDRITLVMTESRVARATGCPPAHLECQISGVRVCVHNMNACDGLPNCGVYDIYDEDRLLCGNSVGFHYTVCLAACIFLMLLLTLLYSVHYWVKRCVPKVSQAFFVYTDKSENILYLESIMRSPNDYDVGSRMVYHSSFFEDDDLSTESMKDDGRKLMKIIRRCLKCLFRKKPKLHSSDAKNQQDLPSMVHIETRRKFSFTEAELRKIGPMTTRNMSVQTGDSLKMAYLKDVKRYGFDTSILNKHSSTESGISDKKMIQLQQSEKELTSLRRIRGMSATMQSNSKKQSDKKLEQRAKEYHVPVEDEVELRSTTYETKTPESAKRMLERKKYEIHSEPSDEKRTARKHLRFEEGAITIEPSTIDLNNEENIDGRRRILLSTDRSANLDLDAIEEDEEIVTSSGRDFRRFWGKGKKKKMQLSLR